MGDLLGSLIWGAKSGQYCVIGGGSLHIELARVSEILAPHKFDRSIDIGKISIDRT
jgi:hypothetical protein